MSKYEWHVAEWARMYKMILKDGYHVTHVNRNWDHFIVHASRELIVHAGKELSRTAFCLRRDL